MKSEPPKHKLRGLTLNAKRWLSRSDRNGRDRFTLGPWQNGKALCCHVTVVCPFADSYKFSAARKAWAADELAVFGLDDRYTFALVALRIL